VKKDASKKHANKDSASIKIAEPITVDRRSRTDRKDEGKAMRLAVPLASHAQWQAPANRRDPIDLLIESSAGRVPELLPIRYGRMMQSPFAFYRGAAAIMAGVALHWQWVRNFWFRIVHFLMIAAVAVESLFGVLCPLTAWEDRLRERAGESAEPYSFIGRWVHELLFFDLPHSVLTASYCAFFLVVLLLLIVAPPRRMSL